MQLVESYTQGNERVQLCKPTIMQIIVTEFGFHDFIIRKENRDNPVCFNSYMLHYVKSGQGIFKTNQQTYHISAGSFFMSPPGSDVVIKPLPEDPWSYYWMSSFGPDIPEIFKQAKFFHDRPIFQVPNREEFEQEFDILFKNTADKNTPHHLFATATFLNIMGKIIHAREKSTDAKDFNSMKSYYCQKIIEEIEENYRDPSLTIQKICDKTYIHHSYACRIFKEQANCSIIQFLIRQRMKEAEILLKYTTLSIHEIADSVGYRDAFHFTKSFNSFFQISPSEYRIKYGMTR